MIEAPEVLRFYDDELSKMLEFMTRGGNNKYVRADRIEELSNCVAVLEDKLAKAVEALELALELADNGLVDFSRYGLSCDADINKHYRTTLAELSSVSCANSKGQDNE